MQILANMTNSNVEAPQNKQLARNLPRFSMLDKPVFIKYCRSILCIERVTNLKSSQKIEGKHII